MQNELSADIIIFYRGKELQYLLLNYTENPRSVSKHWDFTKGRVEDNEKLEETAEREAKEETNLDVEIIPGFKEKINYEFYTKQAELVKKTVYFFVAEAKTKDVKLSFEHYGYKWLNYSEALNLITFDNGKDLLEKVDGFLASRP